MKINWLNVFSILFVTIVISAASIHATELELITEKGEFSKLSNIISGLKYNISDGKKEIIVGYDSSGEKIAIYIDKKSDFKETIDIPLSTNFAFGYMFKLGKISNGDKLLLGFKVILPHPVDYNGEVVESIDGDFPFTSNYSNKNSILSYRFDIPELNIKGVWTFELYNHGSLIITENFNVF